MKNGNADVPVVSIILPTYNRVKTLQKAIQSVFDQSFKDWELIIVDDASTDETQERMSCLAERNKAVRYMRIPRITGKGISEYLNIGLRNSKGKKKKAKLWNSLIFKFWIF